MPFRSRDTRVLPTLCFQLFGTWTEHVNGIICVLFGILVWKRKSEGAVKTSFGCIMWTVLLAAHNMDQFNKLYNGSRSLNKM